MADLKETLYFLDVGNDSLWTQDGSVRIDAVSKAFGETVTREDIINADPEFSREKLKSVLGKDKSQENPGDTGEVADSPDGFLAKEEDNTNKENSYASQKETKTEEVQEVEIYSKAPTTRFIKNIANLDEHELQRDKDSIENNIKSLQAKSKRVEDSISNAKLHLLAVNKTMNAKFPNSTETQAIQSYIKAQNKAREERARKRSLILDNFDISDIDPRAPVDRAMARRNSRGSARPTKI